MTEPLLFELSSPGRTGYRLPDLDVPESVLPEDLLRDELPLPELSEREIVQHFMYYEIQPQDARGRGPLRRVCPDPSLAE
jgi:glycine cleavage system protein P-like pyridoxal-binding family